jgi:hypothetical protein
MNSAVTEKIRGYPEAASLKFQEIRSLIFEIAKTNELGQIEETLKWGQPSYLCKSGSTIRIDWSGDNPESIDIFFNCKTTLIETFKEIFNDDLTYKGDRAIVVPLARSIPQELETCILMALNYHKLKKLPLLGA